MDNADRDFYVAVILILVVLLISAVSFLVVP